MTIRHADPLLAALCRHPIKSVGYETLVATDLVADQPMPWDRAFAIAHSAAPFRGDPESWQPKAAVLRGSAEAELMAVKAEFDPITRQIVLRHPARAPFHGRLPEDGPALVEWLKPLWPDRRAAPDRLVSRRDAGALTDVPDPWVSIGNLASNRALGQRLGHELSIHRWRMNLWLEGLAPWQEIELVGREITIGKAVLFVEEPIARCRATSANPETGRIDLDTLGALRSAIGTEEFGVYARVLQGGRVALGDPVRL